MAKTKKILAFLLLVILSINLHIYKASAIDSGYYIKNMSVNVDVNDKREFKITENIDVYFNEERHGIIRNIPTSTNLEDYEIADISVKGSSYKVENDEGYINIKIGDEDETISGDKTYIITYTMKNYSDERPEGDYIYLNVLGPQWDTHIESFSSTITYPDNANLEKINVTDGEYGNTNSQNVEYKLDKNKIYINSIQTIPPYNAITVNAMLNEGTFKNAPIRQYPYTISNQFINIDITKEKQYIIERDFKVKVNKEYNKDNEIIIDMIDLMDKESNYYLLDMSVKGENIDYSKKSREVFLKNEKDEYNFKVKYTIEQRLSEDISFILVSPNISGKIENLKVKVNSPFNINNINIDFKERGSNLGTDRFNLGKDKQSIYFETKNTVNPGENVVINLDIDKSLFTRPLPILYNIIKFGSPIFLICIILIFFKFKDKNTITSVVEFYPPRHMNSAEVGYVFNESINNLQVTTLLFYWASHKHIKIIIKEKGKFTIEKLDELDNNHKQYEKILFSSLFNFGDGKLVTENQLKGYFSEELYKTSTSIKSEFKKDKALRDKSSKNTGILLSIFSALPIMISTILAKEVDHGSVVTYFIMAISLLIIHLVFYSIFYLSLKKINGSMRKNRKFISTIIFSLIYITIIFIAFEFTDLNIDLIIVVTLVSLIGNILSSLVPRRSDYGKKLLGEIIGFKNFIEVAEKERLEVLLEEDPEYFYNTLPYAQVLGVTKKWVDKFKDISISNSTYYETNYPINDYIAINRLVKDLNKVGASANYHQGTSSGNSGGFGGGGFSGGGSGGGGGSSW